MPNAFELKLIIKITWINQKSPSHRSNLKTKFHYPPRPTTKLSPRLKIKPTESHQEPTACIPLKPRNLFKSQGKASQASKWVRSKRRTRIRYSMGRGMRLQSSNGRSLVHPSAWLLPTTSFPLAKKSESKRGWSSSSINPRSLHLREANNRDK